MTRKMIASMISPQSLMHFQTKYPPIKINTNKVAPTLILTPPSKETYVLFNH